MKLKDGFVFHTIGDENLVVATGKAAHDFNGLIRNNETAAFIYSLLTRSTTEQEIVEAVCQRYTVSHEQAAADVHKLLQQLLQAGIVVDE